jgi:hypothetical protein
MGKSMGFPWEIPLKKGSDSTNYPRLRRLGRCGMGLEVSVNTLAFHGDFLWKNH